MDLENDEEVHVTWQESRELGVKRWEGRVAGIN